MSDFEESFKFRECFNILCGQLLGRGMSRDTYECDLIPGHVVKIEAPGYNQNMLEFETWQRIKETAHAKWFAPVKYLSSYGRVLIMEKTMPVHTLTELEEKYPKMPAFFSDFKRQNYGMLNGQLVCHDYGTNLLMENGMTKRLKKVDWWETH